jgi:hypothetical protein
MLLMTRLFITSDLQAILSARRLDHRQWKALEPSNLLWPGRRRPLGVKAVKNVREAFG